LKLFFIFLFLFFNLEANNQYLDKNLKPLSEKKQKFLRLMLPALDKVYGELMFKYSEVKYYIDNNISSYKISNLKKIYHVDNNQDLLIALYPHPKSITLAQAAMESNWGTSRFFKVANNIFGIWSYNKNEPRIPALEKRGDKVIYLKKYNSLEESIKDYYKQISIGKNFVKFRQDCYNHKSIINLAKDLKMYSEMRDEYSKHLISIIKFNRFEKFDK